MFKVTFNSKNQDGIAFVGVLASLIVIAALVVVGLLVHARSNPSVPATTTTTSGVSLPKIPAVHTVSGVTLADASKRDMQPYSQTLLDRANTQFTAIAPQYFTAAAGQMSTTGYSTAVLWGSTNLKVENTNITSWASALIKQTAGLEGATTTPYATYEGVVRDDSGHRYQLLCANIKWIPVKSDVQAEPQFSESCLGEIQKSTVYFHIDTNAFATAKPQMIQLLAASTINMTKEK